VDSYLPGFGFLTGLSRSWPSVELPGARPDPVGYTTYSPFDWDCLPPVPEWVTADYSWLTASPEHADSTLALAYGGAQHDIGEWDTWAGPLGGSGKQAVVTTEYPECFDLSPVAMEAYTG
jgi:hypothetical protein